MLRSTRLLDVLQEITFETAWGGDAGANAWLNGITWQPRPNRPLHGGAVNTCDPADPTDPNYGCPTSITQAAFELYDAFHAPLLEYTADEVAQILLDRYDHLHSPAFATELINGALSGGSSFSNTAHAPTLRAFGAASLPVEHGIAVLEDELSRTLRGTAGMIHIPPGLLGNAWWVAGLREVNGRFFTALGHEVVADAGYVDAKEPSGQAASGAMMEWMYASGPVRYKKTAPQVLGFDPNEYTNMSRNVVYRWLTAYGILQFDPEYVTAVLVDY